MGGLLLTCFQYPPELVTRNLKVIMSRIEENLPNLLPSVISGVFGDAVLAQVLKS